MAPCFHRIAADLAGVSLTKDQIEVQQKPVRAEIVNHARNDSSYPEAVAERAADRKGKKQCLIM